MKSMDDIFISNKGLYKISKRLKDQKIIELNWVEIFGQMAAQLYDPCLQGNTLSIHTANPSWAQEIKFYKTEFLAKINALISQKIENLYVTYKRKPVKTNIDIQIHSTQAPKKTLLEKIQQKQGSAG